MLVVNCKIACIMLQDKLKTLLLTDVVGSTSFREAFETFHYEDQLTRFRLESLWRKFFPTIMPQSVILNPTEPSYDWVSDPQLEFVLDEVFETGYIVPFLNSLHQFLSIKEVYDSVMSNFSTQTTDPADCYADVWDGSFVKSLPLFIQYHGNILGIQLYMDEVELSNPLGSKKGKHKVSVFYWTLMNLPPKFRSSLRSIQLLGVLSSD